MSEIEKEEVTKVIVITEDYYKKVAKELNNIKENSTSVHRKALVFEEFDADDFDNDIYGQIINVKFPKAYGFKDDNYELRKMFIQLCSDKNLSIWAVDGFELILNEGAREVNFGFTFLEHYMYNAPKDKIEYIYKYLRNIIKSLDTDWLYFDEINLEVRNDEEVNLQEEEID